MAEMAESGSERGDAASGLGHVRGATVAMAVSGGMDSLLGLALLKEAGAEVLALHGLFLPSGPAGEARAKALEEQCAGLGVPLHFVDLTREFEKLVVEPFVAAYARGETPNPCALCNPRIKFGLLLDEALRLGAGRLATGHYARGAVPGGPDLAPDGPVLFRGRDQGKDQSYFLALVERHRLARALFPMASVMKRDVPEELARRGLKSPDQSESNEICFVPDDDYRAFLRERGTRLSGPGPVLLKSPNAEENGRELGRHQGLWNYTPGQRRGLGIAWREPLYVLGKGLRDNALLVGPGSELLTGGCRTSEFNFLVGRESWPEVVMVRTRYRQTARPARFRREGDGLVFEFLEPQSLHAPGQLCVAFAPDGHAPGGRDLSGAVLGGGVIVEQFSRPPRAGPRTRSP